MTTDVKIEHTHRFDAFEVRYGVHDYHMDFEVWRDRDNGDDDAEPMLHGFIKWDGCINVRMGTGIMQHFCTLDETQDVQRGFAAVYGLAREKIPHWME